MQDEVHSIDRFLNKNKNIQFYTRNRNILIKKKKKMLRKVTVLVSESCSYTAAAGANCHIFSQSSTPGEFVNE